MKSKNQHGVHSPFVFDLITKCFYDKKQYSEYQQIVGYKRTLLKNDQFIKVQDLGPGSKKTKNSLRSVSELAKTSGTSLSRAKLLFRLCHYFQPNTTLELGTSLGIATQAMVLGNPKAKILTIEGCANLASLAKTNLKSHPNIEFINETFCDAIANLPKSKFDFVFFDGNHQKEPTLKYFDMLLPKAHNDALFIFDDIYWSRSMTAAWEIIKLHPKVTVTIDTFQWGLVLFRKEQVKEHFVVRV